MHKKMPEDLGAFTRLRQTLSEEPSESSNPEEDTLVAELMRPLDQARADQILDLVAKLPTTDTNEATVIPLRRSRLSVIVLPILAAVAAVFLLVNLGGEPTQLPSAPVADDAAYELAYIDAPGSSRGADVQATFSAGDPVVLRLRPQQGLLGPVTAEIRAIQGAQDIPLKWRVDPTSDRGHLEIHGSADDLLTVASGEWRLMITVVDAATRRPRWHGTALLVVSAGQGPRP